MGAISEFNFNDFKTAIIGELGKGANLNIENGENAKKLQSIFDIAARTDGGDKAELLETDSNGFSELVQNTVNALKNNFEKGLNSLKQIEFIPGTNKTKQSGAIIPDTMRVYENGDLVSTTFGIDDNDNYQIEAEKGEAWSELQMGDYRTKQNGAITPDKMNVYDENGNIEKTVVGFDENNDGYIDGNEKWD